MKFITSSKMLVFVVLLVVLVAAMLPTAIAQSARCALGPCCIPLGGGGQCNPDLCCSQFGYCGTSVEYFG